MGLNQYKPYETFVNIVIQNIKINLLSICEFLSVTKKKEANMHQLLSITMRLCCTYQCIKAT